MNEAKVKEMAKLAALFLSGLAVTFLVAETLQGRAHRGLNDGSYVPTAESKIDDQGWRTDHPGTRELNRPPKTLRVPGVPNVAPSAG